MAATINFLMDQGSDFTYVFQMKSAFYPANSSPNIKATMRREYSSSNAANFTTTVQGSNVSISMPAAQTANLEYGTWVYDVISITNTSTERLVQGRITVNPNVTNS